MGTFKLLLGIVEMCFLPALFIIRYIYGFNLGIIHWMIAGVFFGLGITNIRKGLASKEKKHAADNAPNTSLPNLAIVSNEVKQSDAYQFFLSSYENWRDGYFDTFSNYYKDAATKDSPEKLTGILLNETSYVNFLDRCFKARIPESDEIMFTISDANFMMTNTHLYIAPDLKPGELHVIHICEVSAYTNKGVWMKSGNIQLKNGKEIQFKLDAVPDEKKLRQLQELLNCENLIEV